MHVKNLLKKLLRISLSPFILGDYLKFYKNNDQRFRMSLKYVYPCLKDKTFKTGFDRHYVYHTSWAARRVFETKPTKHTDISSSLYFSGIVSAFVPVDFYDFRPADLMLSNFESGKTDLTNLHFKDFSILSLSCMHTVEHIGLGRYGDPIDPDGDLKAIKELKRVLAVGGNLFFVVPVGKPKIEFNAHRIYSLDQIKEYFKDFELIEFSLIPEKEGAMIFGASNERVLEEDYACGCFWFKKI